jgi:hypothetical protein
VTEEYVFKELCGLNINKSMGHDGIPPMVLRDGAEFLISPITCKFIINCNISEGKVPSELKEARFKPLYKKSDRLKAENYRPVRLLSIVSKILERAVYTQLKFFLTKNNLLYELQSGEET